MIESFEEDRVTILAYYGQSLGTYGLTLRGITWGSVESQRLRFRVLTEIGSVDGKSVLDVGCGLGDLFNYFVEREMSVDRYLGVDINPVLVNEARRTYRGEFEVRDILTDPLEERFDYCFASGAFGIETPNWTEYTSVMLREMFRLCTVGIAVNFLTLYSSTRTGDHYVDPVEMFRFVCDQLSKKIVLRQDYKDNDFTIYAYH